MTLHLPIGPKPALGWSRYRDANPVPTSPLSDDITTAPSGPVPQAGSVRITRDLF